MPNPARCMHSLDMVNHIMCQIVYMLPNQYVVEMRRLTRGPMCKIFRQLRRPDVPKWHKADARDGAGFIGNLQVYERLLAGGASASEL